MPSLPTDGVPIERQLADAPVLASVWRCGRLESWHRGAVAVWHDERPLLALGDVDAPVYCRSAVKPLQALPFLEAGLAEALGIGDAEIAVMCASHDGTDRHVATVRSFLQAGGLREDQLGCGPHAPYDPPSRRRLAATGSPPLRVHNNCSGKHTGFLHLATRLGDDPADYLAPTSRAQRAVQAAVAAMAGVEEPVEVGVDGCGAPTFWLPLAALARSFARLANPAGLPSVRAAACRRILTAAAREPVLFSGERRLCSALLAVAPGRILPKNGAEGVYAVALAPDPARTRCPGGVGIAVKVHDGNERGYLPVVVDLLRHLGALPAPLPDELARYHVLPIQNTRQERVGEVRCAVDWSRA